MDLNPINCALAGLFIMTGAYGTSLYRQHLAQSKKEPESSNLITMKVTQEEADHLSCLRQRNLHMEIKPCKHMFVLTPLERRKICEEFVKEEIASKAALWAYIRSHHGKSREPTLRSRF
jgi:hypothetical protein